MLTCALTVLSACVSGPGPGAGAGHKTASKIPVNLKKEILAHARKNIAEIEKVTEDPGPLSGALAGRALDDMTAEIARDKAEGKVKIRRYGKVKLGVTHFSKGVVGLSFDFDDGSYYVARGNVGEKSSPIPDRRRLSLALAKSGGHWKIINILQAAASPAGTSE